MFYIDGSIPIMESDINVISELRNQLKLQFNLDLFKDIKQGPQDLQVTCPVHSNGHEHSPSCGISTVKKGDVPSGMVHCFTCGYTATLEEMISNLFGRTDHGEFGKQWLIGNFLTVSIETRKDISLDLDRSTKPKKEVEFVSEEELAQYRYYHDYMYKRKLTDEIIEMFDVGYDPEFVLKDSFGNVKSKFECITFPVRDRDGNCLFVARRAIHSKVFHYPSGVDKPLYGVYELPENCREVIVCESIINALTCWVYGKPAIALLGTGSESQYKLLKNLSVRKLILALDPDDAGRRGTEKLKRNLKGYKLITEYVIPEGKDINDLSLEEFLNLEEIF